MKILDADTDPYTLERDLLFRLSNATIPVQVGLHGDPTEVIVSVRHSILVWDFFSRLGLSVKSLKDYPLPIDPSSGGGDNANELTRVNRRLLLLIHDSFEEAIMSLDILMTKSAEMVIISIREKLPIGSRRALLHRRLTQVAPSVVVLDRFGLSTVTNESSGPELSVVVPIYGVEKQLPALLGALETLQQLRSIEVVLIDDGSTDTSGQIAADWAEGRQDCIAVRQENAGCWSARNHGLALASGEYVLFADADDLINTEGMMALIDSAYLTGADVVRGEWTSFNDGTETSQVIEFHRLAVEEPTWNSRPRNAFLESSPAIWRNMYRREFLHRHRIEFPNFPRFDDLPFFFKVSRHIESLVDVPSVVYHYRLSREGQDTGAKDERLFVLFDILNWMQKDVILNGNAGDYRDLVGVQLASHRWAFQLIEHSLRPRYARRFFRQLYNSPKPYSRLDTLAGILKRTRTWRPGGALRASVK